MAMDLNAIVTEVHSRIHRTDISTNVQNILLQQITWLETLEYWPWRTTRDQAGITLASGSWAHNVPADFGEDLAFVIIEDDKENYLERIAFEQFVSRYPDPSKESGGQPTVYTVGYALSTSSAGKKQVWFPHPADATYTSEFIYYNRRADCTGTDFPTGFTELEKLVLVFRAAAHIEGSLLGDSKCNGTPTCHCNACEANSWLGAAQRRYGNERMREKPRWKHAKKRGWGVGLDIRGHQDPYNV